MLGRILRFSLFGESHGCCVGVLLEGVPPGIPLSAEDVDRELERRRPGAPFASPRREPDRVEILSGVYMGYTTGAPVAMLVRNRDVDSSFYEEVVRYAPRPGHADAPARLRSMGFNDYRGGGPFSGRLTAGMVAAGAVAKKILGRHGVTIYAYLRRLGPVECPPPRLESPRGEILERHREARDAAPLPCHDREAAGRMAEELREAMRRGDSLGGQVELVAAGVPPGLGEPPLDPIDGDLAKAMFVIPGVRAFELGMGVEAASARGSEAADSLRLDEETGLPLPSPGYCGGVLGGLTTGAPLVARVTFKPTSTIRLPVETIDWRTLGETRLEGRGRHDPAIAVRAVPVVEAAAALVLADHLLRWLGWRLEHYHLLERGYVDPRSSPGA